MIHSGQRLLARSSVFSTFRRSTSARWLVSREDRVSLLLLSSAAAALLDSSFARRLVTSSSSCARRTVGGGSDWR